MIPALAAVALLSPSSASAAAGRAHPGANIIANPSFEENTSGWVVHTSVAGGVGTGATFARENGWASAGDWSLRLTATPTGAPDTINGLRFIGAQTLNLPVTAGTTYTAGAVVNVLDPAIDGPGLWPEIFYFDAAAHQLAQNNGPSIFQPVSTGVQTVSCTALAPPGTIQAQVVVVMGSATDGDTMDFYLDGTMLSVEPPPTAVDPVVLAAPVTHHPRHHRHCRKHRHHRCHRLP